VVGAVWYDADIMTTRTQLAYLATGIVLVLGLLSLFNPVLAARMLGYAVVAPRGLSELRATYGAMFVTMAALLLWALPLRPRAGLLVRAMGLLWAGAAAGRLASMAIDGLLTLGNLASLGLGLAVAFCLVWASFELPPSAEEVRARREATAARRRLAGARKRVARGTARGATQVEPAGTPEGGAVRSPAPPTDAEGRGGA
jgi:hypothetical protein